MPTINGLAHLRRRAALLNEVTQAATRALELTEQMLNQSGIGMHSQVEFGEEHMLSYGKWTDGYRLLIDKESGKERPWQEWPRQIKIQAAAQLQKLIDLLLKEVDQEINQVDDATLTSIARVNKSIDETLEGSNAPF